MEQFQQHLTRCTTHGHASSEVCAACLKPLSQAVSLYQGDLLTGFTLPDSPEFDDWQLFQTESLRRELAEVLEKLVRGHGAQGEFELALVFARRWLALDPLQESAHRQLMRLLALSGERNAALTQYKSCRQILADELGLEPTVETTALYKQIREGALSREKQGHQGEIFSASSWSSHPTLPRNNLPTHLTPFIGRAAEVTEITRLICDEPDCRLLTLVGPGGIGKTRLALQAATGAVEAFPDGVYFVSLAPISAAEYLFPTIADALGFPLAGNKPKEQLLNYLRQKALLLLLDNFEHLIPLEGTDLLLEIITTARRIKLLVTSRERLNLQPEWGVVVHGLPFPKTVPEWEQDVKAIEAYDAVQLFLQQAHRAKPGFTLSSENSSEVVRICQMVEGVPLGLELAAAWLRMMSCHEIAQEIERNLDFLTTSLRDIPERHQSLRVVFEHSWQLLSEKEKAVFRKLSVFRGGFRHRAAERVAGATMAVLTALLDKSLLRRTRTRRYEIHELLRQYVAEKLNQIPDENEQVQIRHVEYYLTFLQQRTDALKGSRQKETLDEIAADIDNVRVAWSQIVNQRNVMALGKSADGLLLFSDYRSWFVEGEAAFRQAVESLTKASEEAETQGSASTPLMEDQGTLPGEQNSQIRLRNPKTKIVLAQLLRGEGALSIRLGRLGSGQQCLWQSVSLLREAERGTQRELAYSLFWLAHTYWFQGQYHEANHHFQKSLTLYTKAGDRWGIGSALSLLGQVAQFQSDYGKAEQLLQEAIQIFRHLGNRRAMAYPIRSLGMAALALGKYAQAEQFYEEGLQIAQEFDDPLSIAYSRRELGYLAIALGNYPQAIERMEQSVEVFKEIGARGALVFPLDGLGSLARLLGKFQQAKQLHQESLAIAKEIGEGRGIATALGSLGWLAYDMRDYSKAEQRLRESLVHFERLGNRLGIASTTCHLGYVACALGNDRYETARQHFNRSLAIATKIEARPVVLNALVGQGTWLSAGASDHSAQEQAIELLALALHHPASEQETKDRAWRLLGKLKSGLPPEVVAAAQYRGEARNLDTVVMEILEHNGFDLKNSG